MSYRIQGHSRNQAIFRDMATANDGVGVASAFVDASGRPKSSLFSVPVGRVWSSLALRFGGFASSLSALISPLASSSAPDTIAPIFFREKTSEIASLSSLNPNAALEIVRGQTVNLARPWSDLLRVACGDDGALVSLLDSPEILTGVNHSRFTACAISVAMDRPREGRLLLKNLFTRADNARRLQILRAFAENPRLDPKRDLGELFVQLMARSTHEERREEIYPGIMSIVLDPGAQAQAGKSFLRALFRGWLSEDESAGDYLKQIG